MLPLVGSLSASQTSARGIARAILDRALLSFSARFFSSARSVFFLSLPRGFFSARFLFRAISFSLSRGCLFSSARFHISARSCRLLPKFRLPHIFRPIPRDPLFPRPLVLCATLSSFTLSYFSPSAHLSHNFLPRTFCATPFRAISLCRARLSSATTLLSLLRSRPKSVLFALLRILLSAISFSCSRLQLCFGFALAATQHLCSLLYLSPQQLCFGFCSLRRTLLYLSPAPWLIRILLAPLLPFFRIRSSQSPSTMLTLWRSPFLTR